MNLVWLLFSFNGRINRVQFWLGGVIGGIAGALLMVLLALVTLPSGGFAKTPEGLSQFITTVTFAFGAPLAMMSWIGAALQTKRLHDRGRSKLWMTAPMLPALMVAFSLVSSAAEIFHAVRTGPATEVEPLIASAIASAGMWLAVLSLVQLFIVVDLGCMPSKPGPNKYGNPPRDGFGGGTPMNSSAVPGKAAPSQPQPMVVGTGGSTLTSAESAIERAIAARSKQQAAPANAPISAPRFAAGATPQAAAALRPATSGSFGRKASS